MTRRKSVAKKYEPTPREVEEIKAVATRSRKRAVAPRLKVTKKNGATNLRLDHPDHSTGSLLLMGALGTDNPDFLNGYLRQLTNARSQGSQADEDGVNFMLSMVRGVQPQDEIEAMLAAQMAAVHNATMTFARRLNHVDNIQQQDSAERAFNRLGRTFTTQMEALKRYRTSGQQKMTVEHVHVHEGGQAIVGNVGGGLSKKSGPTS
jgi:hypothetical protein